MKNDKTIAGTLQVLISGVEVTYQERCSEAHNKQTLGGFLSKPLSWSNHHLQNDAWYLVAIDLVTVLIFPVFCMPGPPYLVLHYCGLVLHQMGSPTTSAMADKQYSTWLILAGGLRNSLASSVVHVCVCLANSQLAAVDHNPF